MKNMKENLFDKFFQKALCSLGETSIKISENAMGKCSSSYIYEPKISIELLKANIDK